MKNTSKTKNFSKNDPSTDLEKRELWLSHQQTEKLSSIIHWKTYIKCLIISWDLFVVIKPSCRLSVGKFLAFRLCFIFF